MANKNRIVVKFNQNIKNEPLIQTVNQVVFIVCAISKQNYRLFRIFLEMTVHDSRIEMNRNNYYVVTYNQINNRDLIIIHNYYAKSAGDSTL